FVVLGEGQGCPNALLEALAAGLPAVANDDGGTREQLIHEVTGLLVPDRSPEALAAALLRILRDRELAQRLGPHGPEHVPRAPFLWGQWPEAIPGFSAERPPPRSPGGRGAST